MRLAMRPAIWMTMILCESGVCKVILLFSLYFEAFSRLAEKNLPGLYVICLIVLLTGIRFTWTLKIDINMLIFTAGSPRGLILSSIFWISKILPSAGDNTTFWSESLLWRSGSLKKKAIKRLIMPAKTDKKKNPQYKKIMVTAQLANTNGKPSFASGHLFLTRESSNLRLYDVILGALNISKHKNRSAGL